MRILTINKNEEPKLIDIENTLEQFQKIVGGPIEVYMPFRDDVAIICNEEGKIKGLPLNRLIYDEQGHVLDIIAGPFFIAYAPADSEDFLSLPEELVEKYTQMFQL